MDRSDKQADDRVSPTRAVLARALNRARGSLFWERLWPALVSILTALGLFFAFSWFGLWLMLPPLGRAIGLIGFVLLIVLAAIPLVKLHVPSATDALRRLDRGSGEAHRPATTITDRISANQHDPLSQALWRVHIERALLSSAGKFKAGWPSPKLSLRDPIALRALVLMVVVASFFAAGDERIKRVTAAFDWSGVLTPPNFRIDAWITPPTYTGRPPTLLPGLRPGESAPTMTAVSVPVGSQLVIRSSGNVHFNLLRKGGLEDSPADSHTPPLPTGSEEHRLIVKADGSAAVHGVTADDLVWQFTAIPDRAPAIEFTKPPQRQVRGALRLDYKMDDDYGVIDAKAIFALKDEPGAGKARRPLFPAPDFPLILPQARTRAGATQTTRDISEHPWAGADVTVTLLAHDEAGNEGRSASRELSLPQRIFVKPLARALIEQRRNLVLDANAKSFVLIALDALTIAPDKFTPEAGVYLGLRSIYYDLAHAKSDDALREVVARLWDMALQIENDNVNETEQALRQAQEALRQALERGASDEELEKLMRDLRAAMDKFLQALADEMRKNPQQLSRPLDPNTRILSERDLKSMLDRLENLARAGNKDAAQQLLEQLQSMLENLQMARPGASPQDDTDDDAMSALDELGDMIRKQQQLRDKTFKQGQDMQRDQSQNRMGDLRQDQQGLKDRLNKLLDQLRQRGLGSPRQGQNGEQGQGQDNEKGQLGDAVDAMGEAEGELGEGNAEDAVGSQGRALEAMRKGVQGLAQQMQQQGTGPNGRAGRRRARADQDTDPLGRPLRGREFGDDRSVKVPGEIDAQRARRILEELRKRYGESSRPQLELDYIERLLKDF